MEPENIIQLPSSCGLDNESVRNEVDRLSPELGDLGFERHVANGENLEQRNDDDAQIEKVKLISKTETTGDVGDSSCLEEKIDVIEASEGKIPDNVVSRGENGCVNDTEVEEGQLIPETNIDECVGVSSSVIHQEIDFIKTSIEIEGIDVDMPSESGRMTKHETSNSYPETDGGSTSGVKRTWTTSSEPQPSVHVKYYCLSRQSKLKLEELLQEWSKWHARNSSQMQDQNGVLETGEEIYFPALDIGTNKTSAVTFWMDNEIMKSENMDIIPVEDASVPLYDRGFALGFISADGSSNLEGGSELLDAPRCFNCGSYNHSLKECPKPRDSVAVNNSRKQLKSKRNQTAGMRNLTRYYQDSPGGKYEGLRPGVLDAETRQLLGLGEFDPPPWLNRMREIGYPPGYLEPEDENLPSGITIYADQEIKEEKEEGEILEAELVETPRKMSVKFPGINAPIPKNADENVWAATPVNSYRHRNDDGGRSNHLSESNSRGRHREHNNRDFRDDDPLGRDRASRYRPKYGDYDSSSASHSLRENAPAPGSPGFGRSLGDRGRNGPLESEDSIAYSLYSSYSYNSGRRFSEHNNGLDVSRGDHTAYSSRSRDRDDRYHHRSGR